MIEQTAHHDRPQDRLMLGPQVQSVARVAMISGAAGLVLSLGAGLLTEHGLRRFFFAYLVSFCFFLSLALGGLFFVLLQHLTRAGWSVGIRRLAENLAATIPTLAILSLPIALSVLLNNGSLYSWARPMASLQADHLILEKRPFLNPAFFILRLAIYFAVWSFLARWFLKLSTQQDSSADLALTRKMERASAPGILAFALTVTLAAFDLIMSLDPHWYSTIFGVYFFTGSAIACFASLILILYFLQRSGYLQNEITGEHYHDLGKFLFGFTFFWGYIAFSQYMLLWYANIPEETTWLARRGLSTADGQMNGWTVVAALLLLGQFLIPFAGLMSRHVKRAKTLLVFWALWALLFHWVDLYWLVMPELNGRVYLGLPELGALIGVGGFFVASALRIMTRQPLRPLADPRLEESLAFENV